MSAINGENRGGWRIYLLCLVLAAIPTGLLTFVAFHRLSAVSGVVTVSVVGPTLYLILVLTLSMARRFALILLTLIGEISQLPAAVERLTNQVRLLHSDLAALPGAVNQIGNNLQAISPAVAKLTDHVGSLQTTLETAQFWKAPGLRRKLRRGPDGRGRLELEQ